MLVPFSLLWVLQGVPYHLRDVVTEYRDESVFTRKLEGVEKQAQSMLTLTKHQGLIPQHKNRYGNMTTKKWPENNRH